jgi:hypothetical protein
MANSNNFKKYLDVEKLAVVRVNRRMAVAIAILRLKSYGLPPSVF